MSGKVPRIDAHQHFWRLARGDYGWLTPALESIYRDFMPDDLAPLIATTGIEKTILVQAAPSVAETRFMLEIAGQTPFVAGVVGWVDFAAADVVGVIEELADNPLLVGLRPMIHDIADPGWVLRAELAPAFDALQQHGLVFDALVKPPHLPALLMLARRYPALAIVIDHGAKPLIAAGIMEPWRTDMAALAALPHVACKFSGLVTEAGENWSVERLRPYVDHLLAHFGAERLLFGSDWPVCTLAAGYPEWVEAAEALTAHLPGGEKAAIFGGNAARLYLATRGNTLSSEEI